jgi:DNA-binding IclR family transcriptional regulator
MADNQDALLQDKGTVRAVDRALDVLLCFRTKDELGLTEISKMIGLHKSTVHRLLATLEIRGFVRREQSDRYRIGWSILELTSGIYRSGDFSTVVFPEMTALRDRIGETISLYVRSGFERIRIQAVEGVHAVRRVANIGLRFPLHIGASGKVLLAFCNEPLLDQMEAAGTLPESFDKAEFERQLDDIQRRGYAVTFEEREVGAAAVAAPIINRHNQVSAALSISGPVDRFTDDKIERFIVECVASANLIGKVFPF